MKRNISVYTDIYYNFLWICVKDALDGSTGKMVLKTLENPWIFYYYKGLRYEPSYIARTHAESHQPRGG